MYPFDPSPPRQPLAEALTLASAVRRMKFETAEEVRCGLCFLNYGGFLLYGQGKASDVPKAPARPGPTGDGRITPTVLAQHLETLGNSGSAATAFSVTATFPWRPLLLTIGQLLLQWYTTGGA